MAHILGLIRRDFLEIGLRLRGEEGLLGPQSGLLGPQSGLLGP